MMYNMGRFGPMAPQSKDGRLRLGEPLATDLAALRAVIGLGNTEIAVVRVAVRHYIDMRLKNKKIRALYDIERQRLAVLKRKPLHVVPKESS
jgi:hypothetical protein